MRKGHFKNVINLVKKLKNETNSKAIYTLSLDDAADISDFAILDFEATGKLQVTFPKKLTILMKKLKKLLKKNPEKWFLARVGSQMYMINSKNIDTVITQISRNAVSADVIHSSDGNFVLNFLDHDKISISIIKTIGKTPKDGGFFPFINNTPYDLEKYGIYKTIKMDNYKENCLMKAFRMSGIYSEENLYNLSLLIRTMNIPQSKLKVIAESTNSTITLTNGRFTGKNKIRSTKIGTGDNKISLGLISWGTQNGHYFLNDKYPIKLSQVKDYINGTKSRVKNSDITAFKLIKELLQVFEPISLDEKIIKTQFGDRFNKINDLNYTSKDVKKYNSVKKGIPSPPMRKIFIDFESYTNSECHEAYCVVDSTGGVFVGDDCATQFLESLKGDSLLIAHNMSYDRQFLKKLKYLTMVKSSGNLVMYMTSVYYSKTLNKTIKINLKDSYSLISVPLSKFPGMFGLNAEKEVMPYNLYDRSKNMRKINISDAKKHLKNDEEYDQMIKNIDKWNCRVGKNKFDAIKYSIEYCKIDVELLEKGYDTFREWILTLSEGKLDINKIVSAASIADQYNIINGSYNNCYKLSGVPREFIQRCVVGGRVMCANNTKTHIYKEIVDFDACSLYPSAVKELGGYLQGTPKVMNKDDFSNWREFDGVFVHVKVTKIGKNRVFPLLSVKNESGIRNFSNDVVGKEFYMDKISLEDFINFQQGEVEFIRGYYFNEGLNKISSKLIQKLYSERKKKKKEGNYIQIVYKLIMNSSYGRTIMKPIEYDYKFLYGTIEQRNDYIVKNHNYISDIIDLNNGYMFKVKKPIGSHFSAPHIGTSILSMSKRIMNRVMCLSEDEKIDIYYQDTDSVHMDRDKVLKLSESYFEKYDKKLIGKEMGQFHSDFDFKSDEEVYAVESIFLGKKSYCDKIRVINNGIEEFKYHIRMKGIPNWSVKEKGNVMETYEKLFNGEKVTFSMMNTEHIRFKKNPNFSYSTVVNDKGRQISF